MNSQATVTVDAPKAVKDPKPPKAPKRKAKTERPGIPAEIAGLAAQAVLDVITPFVTRATVAGSLRRRKTEVHDVDIVALQSDLTPHGKGGFHTALALITPDGLLEKDGPKIKAFVVNVKVEGPRDEHGHTDDPPTIFAVPVDLYLTDNPERYACLLLVRTGSVAHNISLTSKAKARGWTLHANGDGLFNASGTRVAWRTEEEILAALECPHVDPITRERGH